MFYFVSKTKKYEENTYSIWNTARGNKNNSLNIKIKRTIAYTQCENMYKCTVQANVRSSFKSIWNTSERIVKHLIAN